MKDIELLFSTTKSFKCFPLRVLFERRYPKTTDTGVSILISVPKKKFKKAVQRNRVKRLIRETYRLNKKILLFSMQEQDYDLLIAFIYIGQEICCFKDLDLAMKNALTTINDGLARCNS